MAKKRPKKQGKKRLRDIASMKELSTTATDMEQFKQAMPILGPLFKEFGIEVNKMEEALQNVDGLAKQTSEFVSIPDRFNNFFGDHGWIMYSMMSFEVAKQAVLKAEEGNFKEAQELLKGYYDVETVRFQLKRLNSIKAFRPRMELALKALNDYEEKRYHACVPVILALTDGLVNELHEDRRGISAESTKLEAWDSIAAHSQGLGKLVRILRKGRRKTTAEQISLPYRNGILHGTDLGYDNITVAAKTWAALFAVGEWATKAERGELGAPEEKPEETLQDLLTKIQENEKAKKEIEEWKPRESIAIEVESFASGSPEHVLKEYLSSWSRRNYGGMTKLLPSNTYLEKEAPARIREYYEGRLLKSFEFISIIDVALANTTIEVQLQIEEYGKTSKKLHKFIMINEDAQGNPVSRVKAGSKWVSHTWRVW
ncbi:hypothetical protein P4H66_28900 [Paenibacillus dokdonensis]|uniref:DUF5636 domain-containing protein n=1 Tax=Paenibacillus dokdonensis TaxID=2567944 RepID=A0ABU6GX35_9BACL|nr:hypothetical protein [Paenibacillus dokdonensis]MEC0243833.1 hypothetical protein [Paenibacillus dokdonensis]